MNKKQRIRLNEAQLKRVVAEAVKRVLNENAGYDLDFHGINNINVGCFNTAKNHRA